ncbi:MAG: hypothetical protein QOG38_2843, partial [Hyphomicrobiales bacterium]|nr:hypothetical protein [Hyphomicrobiales bacterium]
MAGAFWGPLGPGGGVVIVVVLVGPFLRNCCCAPAGGVGPGVTCLWILRGAAPRITGAPGGGPGGGWFTITGVLFWNCGGTPPGATTPRGGPG